MSPSGAGTLVSQEGAVESATKPQLLVRMLRGLWTPARLHLVCRGCISAGQAGRIAVRHIYAWRDTRGGGVDGSHACAMTASAGTRRPELGVLFVHGIGEQARGQTLTQWG
jgi:hypothetical protein